MKSTKRSERKAMARSGRVYAEGILPECPLLGPVAFPLGVGARKAYRKFLASMSGSGLMRRWIGPTLWGGLVTPRGQAARIFDLVIRQARRREG